MKRVIIESPFAGDVQINKEYLEIAILDALSRGESPYASHGFFTHFLDDTKPDERMLGIKAGLAWSIAAEGVVYYLDLGLTSGMRYALEKHTQAARSIEVRMLYKEADIRTTIDFNYKNHRGETSQRSAEFKRFYWGRTKYHPKDQILMEAYCLDRKAQRVFSVDDMTIIPSAK